MVADSTGFLESVEANWQQGMRGTHMYIVWKKLQRLQPVIRDMMRPLYGIKNQIENTRENLRLNRISFKREWTPKESIK